MKTEYHILITVLDNWIENIKGTDHDKNSKVFVYDEDAEIIDSLLIGDIID